MLRSDLRGSSVVINTNVTGTGPSTIWTNLVEGRPSGYAKINFLRFKLNFGSINTEEWGPNF